MRDRMTSTRGALRAVATAVSLAAAAASLAADGADRVGAPLHGVWIGTSLKGSETWPAAAVAVRDLDFAFLETATGFELSWKALRPLGAPRTTTRFVTTGEPGRFEAPPPATDHGVTLRAQIAHDSLVIVEKDALAQVARYEYSASGGRIAFTYSLTIDGRTLERASGTLARAKVKL